MDRGWDIEVPRSELAGAVAGGERALYRHGHYADNTESVPRMAVAESSGLANITAYKPRRSVLDAQL